MEYNHPASNWPISSIGIYRSLGKFSAESWVFSKNNRPRISSKRKEDQSFSAKEMAGIWVKNILKKGPRE